MEKLPMCRICLAENFRMYEVVNKDLHDLYEKLTDFPFVTTDSRPTLLCFFCCAKLKQCLWLLEKCLEAEELFAQMMNEDYELNPAITVNHLEMCGGFIISPVEHISILDKHQTKIVAIKEELPPGVEKLDDTIESNEGNQRDDPEPVSKRSVDVVVVLPEYSDSDTEDDEDDGDDMPVIELTTDVREPLEVFEEETRASINNARVTRRTKPGETSTAELKKRQKTEIIPSLDMEDALLLLSKSSSEDDIPPMEITTHVEEPLEELPAKTRRVAETISSPIIRITKLEDTVIAGLKITGRSDVKETGRSAVKETGRSAVKETGRSDVRGTGRSAMKETGRSAVKETGRLDVRGTGRSDVKETGRSDVKENRAPRGRTPKTSAVVKKPRKRRQRSSNRRIKAEELTRTRSGEKRYKCATCQRSFNEKATLRKHIRTHTGVKPYNCNVCRVSFRKSTSLAKHIRTHPTKKPYKCDVCERGFAQTAHLIKHKRTHTGEKPYMCDICSRSFSVKGSLMIHIRQHTGEKPFKCEVCQRTFRQRGSLVNHMRTHTGDKPYTCNICNRSFRQKTPLKKHKIVHTGEKPYSCDVCERRFGDKTTLSKHFRIHTGEKPFKCEICQYSFSQKINLTNHIRTHTGEKPYKCDVCNRGFTQKAHLIKHIRIYTVFHGSYEHFSKFNYNSCISKIHQRNYVSKNRILDLENKPKSE